MKIFIPFVLLLFFPGALPGQERSVLDQYIKEGLNNNLALKRENLNIQQSLQALRQAKGMFMPNVRFAASYTLASGGRTIQFPVGDIINPINQTLNELTDSDQFPTNVPNVDEQFFPDNFHDTRIEIRQPLFNSDIYFNNKAKKSLVNVQEAQRDTYRQELTKEIKVAYFDYLKTVELINILDSTEVLLQALLDFNESLYRNHKVTEDAVFTAEFELADLQSQRTGAIEQREIAASYFNFLLNKDLQSEIIVDKDLKWEKEALNLNELQEKATLNRTELEQTRYAIEANNSLLDLNKGAKYPELSAGILLGYQGFGYEFDQDQDYGLFQFDMSIPLFTGFVNNAKIQESKYEQDKLNNQYDELKKQIRLQVIQAYRSYQSAVANFQAKQAAKESAQKSLDIIRKKYVQSQVLLVELLDARNKYTRAELQMAIAKYDVLIRKAELERSIALQL